MAGWTVDRGQMEKRGEKTKSDYLPYTYTQKSVMVDLSDQHAGPHLSIVRSNVCRSACGIVVRKDARVIQKSTRGQSQRTTQRASVNAAAEPD